MSVVVIAGSKSDILKVASKLVKGRHSVIITCYEQDLSIFKGYKVILLENLNNLPSILIQLKDIEVVIINLYDLIRAINSRYGWQLANRLIEKVFVTIYAFSKARNVYTYVLSPLNLDDNEPLIRAPGYIRVSKVKLL